MLLKLGWYQFKLDSYKFRRLSIIPMVTTKKYLKNTHKRKWEGSQMLHHKKEKNTVVEKMRDKKKHTGHIKII